MSVKPMAARAVPDLIVEPSAFYPPFSGVGYYTRELLKAYNVKKIVTACPHCFNSFKKEYPQFGGDFEVVHHTQFIADLINDGKLKLGGLDGKTVTYHDSCYLGRYNDIYQAPRDILKVIKGVNKVEMTRSGSNGFCCGGGGGHMWLEEEPDKRINARRTQDVIDVKADLVATACPYCLTMFEDGLRKVERGMTTIEEVFRVIRE